MERKILNSYLTSLTSFFSKVVLLLMLSLGVSFIFSQSEVQSLNRAQATGNLGDQADQENVNPKEYLFGDEFTGDLYEDKKLLFSFGLGYSLENLAFGSFASGNEGVSSNFKVPPLYLGLEVRFGRFFSIGNRISYSVSTITLESGNQIELGKLQNSTRLAFHLPLWIFEWYLGSSFDINFYSLGNSDLSNTSSLFSDLFGALQQTQNGQLATLFQLGLGLYNISLFSGFRINLFDFSGLYLEVGLPLNLFSAGVYFRL